MLIATLFVELPSVPWSTVPGPRSRGYTLKQGRLEDEKTFNERHVKFHNSLVAQLSALLMKETYVVTAFDGKENMRTQV